MNKGIYTLANDVVYDQLVALLNSINANAGSRISICIIPYDDRMAMVREEILLQDNVALFDNQDSIQRWEAFFRSAWAAHPMAKTKIHNQYKGGHRHRKFCSFDGPFDKFIFCDADSLLMKPVDDIFKKLDRYDFVFDDWEHGKPDATVSLNLPLIESTTEFNASQIRYKIHCDSFFGSKKGMFPDYDLKMIAEELIQKDEISWINNHMWWDSATLFTYMTIRLGRSQFNFTQSPNGKDRTGNCANADPFINVNNVLYNQEGKKPIHRIHYMGYGSDSFRRLCKGEDVDIRYREVFLHYRFVNVPEMMPKVFKKPSTFTRVGRILNRILAKLKRKVLTMGFSTLLV